MMDSPLHPVRKAPCHRNDPPAETETPMLRRTALGALFGRVTPALPVDIFRALVGLLSFVYFLSLWREAADFSAPDGLIDHALVQDVFWFTRLGLFQAGISSGVLQGMFFLAAIASWGLILGWRPKLCAGFLFVTAVSAFRWNFLVAYVDDAIVDLMLFWLLLLPIGRTLTLRGIYRDPRNAWKKWQEINVPGTVVGCFLCNLALIYFVSGIWKWTSPMWRDGTALFAVLQLPVSRAPNFWQAHPLPLLKVLDWSSLVLEPFFPIAFLLRRGHPIKWLLLVAIIGFHVGIVATMRIPFANLACLAASVFLFREELMTWLRRGAQAECVVAPPARSGWCGKIAVAFVVVLSLAMLRHVPIGSRVETTRYDPAELSIDPRGAGGLTAMHKPLYCALWFAGIAQEYQLFNWIDVRNYRFRYTVTRNNGTRLEGIDPSELFPRSNRAALLEGYLHDRCWFEIPSQRSAEFKRSLATRFAERFARAHPLDGTIVVTSTVERITAANPRAIERGPEVLFSFAVRDGNVALLSSPATLSPPPPRLTRAFPTGASF